MICAARMHDFLREKRVKGAVRTVALAMLVFLTGVVDAAPDSGERAVINVRMDPALADPDAPVWLGYLLARANYVKEHESEYDWKPGVITPSFGEELAALTTALKIYRELQQKNEHLQIAYFDDLARVIDQSYLGEYVWTYLHESAWETPPDKLRFVDFMHWRATNLAQHQALPKGDIVFATKGVEPPKASPTWPREDNMVLEAKKALDRGDEELAIAEYLDPVIGHFERTFHDKVVFAARNKTQQTLYFELAKQEKKDVAIIGEAWPDAYLMKAYILSDLHDINAAQEMLKKAIALSPKSAQYISELGYTYEVQGQCDRAITLYEEAASAAEVGSDDDHRKVIDLTRAWRGKGYCLTEQGRLDEAEQLYWECLKLDPEDNKAKNELKYISSRRRVQKQ
jgi:tetratricopeptide (TPR) repeat protein